MRQLSTKVEIAYFRVTHSIYERSILAIEHCWPICTTAGGTRDYRGLFPGSSEAEPQ
jgi:hypothetical protein